MKQYKEDRYNEELLDKVFLFGLSGLKKYLKTTGSAVGAIAVCTFAIITGLLISSDFGSTEAGVVLSILIGTAIGGIIACLAIPVKKRERVAKNKFRAVEKNGKRTIITGKEGSAA